MRCFTDALCCVPALCFVMLPPRQGLREGPLPSDDNVSWDEVRLRDLEKPVESTSCRVEKDKHNYFDISVLSIKVFLKHGKSLDIIEIGIMC